MVKRKLLILVVIFCSLLNNNIYSQSKNKIAVSTGFLQIKDNFNQGMVFNGAMIKLPKALEIFDRIDNIAR